MSNNQITIDGQQGRIGANGVVQFGNDELMNVVFYVKSVRDDQESRARGRPWHKAITYVRIQHPGEKDYIDRPVGDDDMAKMRWARQWQAFEARQEQAPQGTPLDVLFPLSPEIPANLRSLAIHTVEQLAGLTAHGLQTIGMGATQWQQAAKQFMEAANGGKGMHRLRLENERLSNSLEVQANQIALMKAQLEKLAAATQNGLMPNMIPNMPPPLAQAHAETLHETYEPLPELSDEPLFVAVADELEGPAISNQEAPPRRRGRPPNLK